MINTFSTGNEKKKFIVASYFVHSFLFGPTHIHVSHSGHNGSSGEQLRQKAKKKLNNAKFMG